MLLKYNVAIFKRVATHIWRYPSCSKVPTEFSPPPPLTMSIHQCTDTALEFKELLLKDNLAKS